MKKHVVALFRKYDDAEHAVDDLLHRGVDRDNISLMAAEPTEPVNKRAEAGAVIGEVALAVPGIGPVLAAGPLAASLAALGGGAVAGGLMGAFIGLGLSEDAAQFYAAGVEAGGAVVAVRTGDPDRVLHQLSTYRGAELRRGTGGTQPRETLPQYGRESIEPPGLGSHQMATGDAVSEEEARDTRVLNDAGPEHWAPHNPKYTSSFDEFAGAFVRDHSDLFAERSPSDYKPYLEAYSFGYRSALDDRFFKRTWDESSADLRSEWERNGERNWQETETSVQRGWQKAKGWGDLG